MACTVVNKHYQEYDVYIGRGSKWGNPFTHIKDRSTKAEFIVETREDSISNYETWLRGKIWNGSITRDSLLSLDNKRLGCFCAPKSCHGDIISKLVEEAKNE